jgi:moderate conductance mechanosensitive channel
MKQNEHQKKKISKGTVRIIIVLSFICAVIAFAVIMGTVPELAATQFGTFINSTIGKYFNVASFFENNFLTIIESLVIIFFVWALNEVVKISINFVVRKFPKNTTVWVIIRSVFKYGTVLACLFLILSAWGVDTPTLLAGVGILGLAISFGAQSLIEDVISGLFIIFEKQFLVGDIIQVSGFRGKVLEIGVRTTTLEDLNGDVLIINNSELRQTINTSINLSPAICDISFAYSEDVERVEKIIKDNLEQIKENIPDIIEGPFYKGIQSLADSSIVVRVVARVDEIKKGQVARDLNKQMILLFEKNHIEIPFNQIVVHYDESNKK